MAGESVVDVPPKLSARVRVLSTGNSRKNDGLDALATGQAASRRERLAAVDHETAPEVLRLLSERREDLVAERTSALNRLHGLLRPSWRLPAPPSPKDLRHRTHPGREDHRDGRRREAPPYQVRCRHDRLLEVSRAC